jgi:Uma2 family endonuclease
MPTETASDLEDKLRDYRLAGTAVHWVVDLAERLAPVTQGK